MKKSLLLLVAVSLIALGVLSAEISVAQKKPAATTKKKTPAKSAPKKKPTKPEPATTPASVPATMPTSLPASFIGSACQTNNDCAYANGICLTEKQGFPGGMCSMECDLLCPRADLSLVPTMARAGAPPSLCVSPKSLGQSGAKGLCTLVSKSKEPNGGCRLGYVPTIQIRNSASDSMKWVCTPSVIATPKTCAEAKDELVEIAYPDRGRVYIPKEARCGGRFDLIIIMHGDQSTIWRPAPNLGEGLESNRLDEIARTLIDEKKSRPVILAEPVENNLTCSLWDEDGFSPTYYLSKVKEALAERKIEISTISVFGHSRGACCLNGGVYRMGRVIPNLKLWGKSDGCYKDDGFDTYPEQVLAKTDTIAFTMQKTAHLKESNHLEVFTTKKALKLECDDPDLKTCYKNPDREWYSFQTDTLEHRAIPKVFLKEILTRFFPPK